MEEFTQELIKLFGKIKNYSNNNSSFSEMMKSVFHEDPEIYEVFFESKCIMVVQEEELRKDRRNLLIMLSLLCLSVFFMKVNNLM